MALLSEEIAAFERMKDELETDHFGKWVVIHDEKLIAVYDGFEQAAEDAVRHFGRGPYLIRQVGVAASGSTGICAVSAHLMPECGFPNHTLWRWSSMDQPSVCRLGLIQRLIRSPRQLRTFPVNCIRHSLTRELSSVPLMLTLPQRSVFQLSTVKRYLGSVVR